MTAAAPLAVAHAGLPEIVIARERARAAVEDARRGRDQARRGGSGSDSTRCLGPSPRLAAAGAST